MSFKFLNAWGYQGDAMNLPVANVDESAEFYVEKMGFTIKSRIDEPYKRIVLARPDVLMAINDNGGDPTQDGVAFEVSDAEAALSEFRSRGLDLDSTKLQVERRKDGTQWRMFFVVAPDGLCFWLGEKIA